MLLGTILGSIVNMVSSKRPTRAYVLSVYFKRLIRWRRDSSPFISGDAFAKLADVEIGGSKWRNHKPTENEISTARVIYCRSDLLQEFFNNLSSPISAKVVMCGNSDFEFHSDLKNIPDSVEALFLQNSFISDNKRIFTRPIGIENFRLGVNGHPRLMRPNSNFSSKEKFVLFGPFGNTHPIRLEILKLFSSADGPWEILRGSWKPRDYAKVVRKTKWIASVRGNGVDTHRLWESLYRGSVPIVKDDAWAQSLNYLNLPIITLKNWEPEAIRNIVDENLPLDSFSPKELEALWMPYWEKRIRKIADSKN
jgi:hypothetical protein